MNAKAINSTKRAREGETIVMVQRTRDGKTVLETETKSDGTKAGRRCHRSTREFSYIYFSLSVILCMHSIKVDPKFQASDEPILCRNRKSVLLREDDSQLQMSSSILKQTLRWLWKFYRRISCCPSFIKRSKGRLLSNVRHCRRIKYLEQSYTVQKQHHS